MRIAILGLGEAGTIFANEFASLGIIVSGWDPALKRKLHESIRFAKSNVDAAKGADIVMSVNLSAVSEAVAEEVRPVLTDRMIYAEMNTSSPVKKKKVESTVKSSRVQFVDLAIMAPVPGKGIKVPLLASGPGARLLHERLLPYALDLTYQSDVTGEAAERKLLRSIVYKGVAAVICEAVEAGERMGKLDYIRSQIRSILNSDDIMIDRFVEGSHEHAKRRVEEMEAVKEMLATNDLSSVMTEGSILNLRRYEKE